MLDQYKKTVTGMQVMIAAIAGFAYFQSRSLSVALFFFSVMQVFNLAGALWATRIKHKLQRPEDTLSGRV